MSNDARPALPSNNVSVKENHRRSSDIRHGVYAEEIEFSHK